MKSKQRTIITILTIVFFSLFTGCDNVVVQPYKHKTIYESIYGRKPPYDDELQQLYVIQGK